MKKSQMPKELRMGDLEDEEALAELLIQLKEIAIREGWLQYARVSRELKTEADAVDFLEISDEVRRVLGMAANSRLNSNPPEEMCDCGSDFHEPIHLYYYTRAADYVLRKTNAVFRRLLIDSSLHYIVCFLSQTQ